MDPRVKTPSAGLARQFALGSQLAAAIERAASAGRSASAAAATPGAGRSPAADSLGRLAGDLAQLYGVVEGSDAVPTPQVEAAVADRVRTLDALISRTNPARQP
jgi:hypothetical protein